MTKKLFSRRHRPVWIAIILALILGIAFTFPQTRIFANNFLALFRVQRIEIVEFDPASIPETGTLQDVARDFESMLIEQVQFEMDGDFQVVEDVNEANTLSGFPLRLPRSLTDEFSLVFRPSARVTLLLDLELTRKLFSAMGQSDVTLPESLDSAMITISFPSSVIVIYGTCATDPGAWSTATLPTEQVKDCTMLMQMPSPTISAPLEFDVDQLGAVYLRLLGMSPKEAASFSQRTDWATTLIIPVPRSADTVYLDVTVDGVPGTFIQQEGREDYVLMWIKHGIVYVLMGADDDTTVLEIANSLR